MAYDAKQFAGSHCGCRYQQDYRPVLGRDGKKESGTLEVMKFEGVGHAGGHEVLLRRQDPL